MDRTETPNARDDPTRALATLRATLDSTNDGILVTNARGEVVDCNEPYVRMSGIPADAIVAGAHPRQVEDLFADPAAFLARLAEIEATAPAETFDVLTLTDGKVPAVALTAFARVEDRTRALRSGFLAHLSKPIDAAELVATIAAIAHRDQ